MDITSIIIMVLGLIILVALFIASRSFTRVFHPIEKNTPIPVYKDEAGNELTSIKADFPAKDDSSSHKSATINPSFRDVTITTNAEQTSGEAKESDMDEISLLDEQIAIPEKKRQFVLFISADQPLNGIKILKTLYKNDLSFGEMDVFHYMDSETETSIFSVANGVEPWTLIPENIEKTETPGLSLVLQTPCSIASDKALSLFITIARSISVSLDADLLNQQQQLFSEQDELLWHSQLT